jgi:hypothetical protein
MKRPLTQDDATAHCHLRVCAPGFESGRRLRDGWLEANPIKLIEDDSLPEEDDYS